MTEHKIPCPKCGQPMRHRVLSGLWWCANTKCSDYKGVPPIKVNANYAEMGKNLMYAMSDEAWNEVEAQINQT